MIIGTINGYSYGGKGNAGIMTVDFTFSLDSKNYSGSSSYEYLLNLKILNDILLVNHSRSYTIQIILGIPLFCLLQIALNVLECRFLIVLIGY